MSDEIIKVHCPECSKLYKVKKTTLGKKTTCRQCGTRFEIKLANKKAAKKAPDPTPAPEPEQKEEVAETQVDDGNGLKFCPTCELQIEHANNICSVCGNENTGEKPLVEKVKSHPLLSKEIKTPLGSMKLVPLVGGVFGLLLAVGVYFIFFSGPEPKPKKKPRPKKVAVQKPVQSQQQAKVEEPEEIVEEGPVEWLPEKSILTKSSTSFRPVPYSESNNLIIGLATSKELIILNNREDNLEMENLNLLGSFKKFRFSLYSQSQETAKGSLKELPLEDFLEKNVVFEDFYEKVDGKIAIEEDVWVFKTLNNKRPRKTVGMIKDEGGQIVAIASGVKSNSLLIFPLNATKLSNEGMWSSSISLNTIIESK